MKKRNRFLALALTVVLAVSTAACGKEKEVDPFAAAQENMANVTSVEAAMLMEMDMEMEAYGETQAIEMDTRMDMTTFSDPERVKIEMTMDLSMGEMGSTTQDMTMYAEAGDNDTYTMYLLYGDTWMAEQVSVEDMAQYDASGDMASYLNDSYQYEQKGIEQLDSGSAYRYSGRISGEDLMEVLLSTGTLDQLSQLGMDLTELDSLPEGVEDITIDLWIDETTLYPVKYEMDMSSTMNTLMNTVMAGMGEQAEGLSIQITKTTLSMTCSNYNAAVEFEIPAEAKAQAQ